MSALLAGLDVGTTHTKASVYRTDGVDRIAPTGRAAPAPDPHRTLSFHGLRPEHILADLGRAVLEGLSMHVRWTLGAALLADRAIGIEDPPAAERPRGPGPAPEWEKAYRSGFLPLVTVPPPGRLPESEEPQ